MARTAKKSYTLVTFDTGERTGWCTAVVEPQFDPSTGHGFFILDQGVLTITELMDKLPALVEVADVVEYETWRLYETHALSMIGNDMQPSQVVGMVRYEARKQGKKIKSYGATIKNTALKTMPQWLAKHMAKSSEQHDQDAIMHAWYYAIDKHYRENK